jgi:hypothetical protein
MACGVASAYFCGVRDGGTVRCRLPGRTAVRVIRSW